MVKQFYQENKLALLVALGAYVLYMGIVLLFYPATTIFFNNSKYDVLFHSDTGILFKGDWFYGTAADLRHFLFRNFMSPFIFPAKLIFGLDVLQNHPTIYGMYIANLQSIFMAVNTFIVMKLLKHFHVHTIIRVLIGILFVTSWHQILFAVNIERFFFGQFSLLLFLLLIYRKKTDSMVVNAIGGVLLIGTTITNVYLYFANLLVQKMKVIVRLKHVLVFGFIFYVVLLFGGGGNFLVQSLTFYSGYTEKFTEKYGFFELPEKIFSLLLYPVLFPPVVDSSYKDAFFQTAEVKLIPALLTMLVLAACVFVIWKKRSDQLVLLLGIILLANVVLHGFIQFGLNSGALYLPHFSFAIFLLLGVFTTLLPREKLKWSYVGLSVLLVLGLYETIQLYIDIYNVGVTYYPRP